MFIKIGDFRYNTNQIVSYWIGTNGKLNIETTNSNDSDDGADILLNGEQAKKAMEILDNLLIKKS